MPHLVSFRRGLLLAALVVLGLAAPASAALQNAGFEDGLAGWTASRVGGGYGNGYGYQPPGPPQPVDCRVPDGVCVLEHDSFTTTDGYGSRDTDVEPAEGSKMVRLGGPFTSSYQPQKTESYRLEQTFTVAEGQQLLELAYNVFTWDYTGFDELIFRVTLTDADGDLLTEQRFGSFGQGVSLKTTGWRPASIDLTGYEGEQVTLRIQAGGTRDSSYGFWAYVDAGTELPASPVGTPQHGPLETLDGDPVVANEQIDPATGLWWLSAPPGECIPLPLAVPIEAGAGTLSDVELQLETAFGRGTWAMTDPAPADDVFTATIDCIQTGQLFVAYTLTEGGESQRYVVPIGGLTLIDPQGIVYDKEEFDELRAAGASEAAAREQAALAGAVVRLQREVDGAFVNVLSGDPGIMPKLNPQITNPNGVFQWDVAAGRYRVLVTKDGYNAVTSRAVDIPPPVFGLHVAMARTGGGGGGGGGGDAEPPGPIDTGPPIVVPPVEPPGITPPRPGPPVVTPKPKPCAGLRGARLRRCQANRRLAAALRRCGKLSRSKRAACRAKARRRAACQRLSSAGKRRKCLARVNRRARRGGRRG
ncbi:MAG TPA: hypothetical protein VF529_15630 [Solirubrobacteraceae bacterium]